MFYKKLKTDNFFFLDYLLPEKGKFGKPHTRLLIDFSTIQNQVSTTKTSSINRSNNIVVISINLQQIANRQTT